MICSITARTTTAKGFTLVEVLVSLTIFSVVMISALGLQQNSTKISTILVSTSTMTEDLRNAAAIITDEVQRALYVFPPCGVKSGSTFTPQICSTTAFPTWYSSNPSDVNYTFSSFTLGASGSTRERPDNASTTWQVGLASAPMLAMIVGPRRPGTGSCNVAADKAANCYQFVAYYPVKRSAVTNTTSTSTEKFDLDPANNNQWVLMEYRENLDEVIASRVLTVSGQTITAPEVRWDQVGCELSLPCAYGRTPTPDPGLDITTQKLPTALPALPRTGADSLVAASFVSRMFDTRAVINGTSGTGGAISGNILMDGILPTTGFQIEYPAASLDTRGATEVRLRIQAQTFRAGTEFRVPLNAPIEVYASPRNLPPSN